MTRSFVSWRRQAFDEGGEFRRLFAANVAEGVRKDVGQIMIAAQGECVDQLEVPVGFPCGEAWPVAKVEMEGVTLLSPRLGRDVFFEALFVEHHCPSQRLYEPLLDTHASVRRRKSYQTFAHIGFEEPLQFRLRLGGKQRAGRRKLDE